MEKAGTGLAQIMADLLRGAAPQDAPVFAWPVVCGPAVAERTRALLFARGVLHVEVSGTGWRAQLTELEGRYLGEFAQLLGANQVKRIEFVTRENPQ
jgi:hypothetical protein